MIYIFRFFAKYISYTFSVALFHSVLIVLLTTLSFVLALLLSPSKSIDLVMEYYIWYLITVVSVVFLYYVSQGFFTPIGVKAVFPRNRKINVFYKNGAVGDKDENMLTHINGLITGSVGSTTFYVLLIHISMASIAFYKYLISGNINQIYFFMILKILGLSFLLSIVMTAYPSMLLVGNLINREKSRLIHNSCNEKNRYNSPLGNRLFSIYTVFLAILFIVFSGMAVNNYCFLQTDILFIYVNLGALALIFLVFFTCLKSQISTSKIRKLNDYMRTVSRLDGNMEKPELPVQKDLEFFAVTGMETIQRLNEKIIQKEGYILSHVEDLKHKDDEISRLNSNLDKQLDMAGVIQKSLLPEDIKDWNEIKFSVKQSSIDQIGGDFYDVISYDNKRIGIVITDPSNSGVSAALLSAMSKVLFRNSFMRRMSPKIILKNVNRNILNLFKSQDYLSCFLAVIDDDYNMSFSNASHQKAILLKSGGLEVELLDTEGVFIGVADDKSNNYEEKSVQLEYGDRVIFYSDGVVEAQNSNKEMYGLDRFVETIHKYAGKDLSEFNENILNDVVAFTENSVRKDDMTILVLELIFDDAVEYIRKSRKLIETHNYLEAVDVLEEGLAEFPDNSKILYNLSKNYFRINNYPKAISLLEKYVESDKNNKYAYYVMGASYFQLMKYNDALNCFESAISLDPAMTNAIFALAMSYKNSENYDKAIQNFEKVLNIDPDNKLALFEINQIRQKMESSDSQKK